MSTYLWGALIFMSVASVVCIVTALVAAIEDDNRRFGAIMTVISVAGVTIFVCGMFLALHKKSEAREVPDVAQPALIEPFGATRSPPEASA